MTIFSANDSSIVNPYSYQTLRTYGKGEELKKKIFVRNFENIFKPIGYTWLSRYKLGFNCSNIICLYFHLLNRQFKVPDRKRLWVRVSIWMGLCISTPRDKHWKRKLLSLIVKKSTKHLEFNWPCSYRLSFKGATFSQDLYFLCFWNKCDTLRDLVSVTIWRLHGLSNEFEWMLTLFSTLISFLFVCIS